MLRHSFATLERERVGICNFLLSPPLPWVLPSLTLLLIVIAFLFPISWVVACMLARPRACNYYMPEKTPFIK